MPATWLYFEMIVCQQSPAKSPGSEYALGSKPNESTTPYWADLRGLRMLTKLSEAIFHKTGVKRQ